MLRKFDPGVIDVEYPTSDGRPMAETDVHRQLLIQLVDVLELRYADDPNVYVSGNLLLCYEREIGGVTSRPTFSLSRESRNINATIISVGGRQRAGLCH